MSENWERAAEAVKQRRAELGLSQRAAARLADDISPTSWARLESKAEPVLPVTAAAICKALRWTSDSLDRIRRGDEPIPLPPDDVIDLNSPAELLAAIHDLTAAVRELRADLRSGRR